MSRELPIPPVPDLARARGFTVSEVAEWFVQYYNSYGGPFNYRSATRGVRAAYRGITHLHLLTALCSAEKTAIGRSANTEVVTLAAPLAFGRNLQVFDMPPQRFQFGRDKFSAYRVPFFFVERGVVHVYYLQPRKRAALDLDQLGMVATIVKRFLLETEFFGHPCDVEFVDVSAPIGSDARWLRSYSLSDLPLWSDRRLTDRLTIIAEALDLVVSSGRVERRHRPRHAPDPSMPLFD
jgi:hypothetical protein